MWDANTIDDFVNNSSDQAAAWYSIITKQPVAIPSAEITAQTNVANLVPVAGQVTTPIGGYVGTGPGGVLGGGFGVSGSGLLLLAAVAVAGYFVWKG
jgi:hypothetical protein